MSNITAHKDFIDTLIECQPPYEVLAFGQFGTVAVQAIGVFIHHYEDQYGILCDSNISFYIKDILFIKSSYNYILEQNDVIVQLKGSMR